MTVYRFDHAIVRSPAPSVVNGLRERDQGPPDFAALCAEHRAYVVVLEAAGLAVTMLAPIEAFPDAIFVEDPALVFGDTAILLRPGAPSRAGEVAAIRPALAAHFSRLLDLADGHVDGGDILVTPAEVLIGLSARTDLRGATSLTAALAQLGRAARIVTPPRGVLHLKTGANLIDDTTLLVTAPMAATAMFPGFDLVVVPAGEEAAANVLRLNDKLLVGRAFPRTLELLAGRGHDVVAVDVEQIGKLDAGLSCLSLRWQAPATQR